VTSGEPIGKPLKAGRSPCYASFSPDGRLIFATGYDRTAYLWDAATGELAATPLKYDGQLVHLSFHGGECHILTAQDQVGRIGNVSRSRPATPLLLHKGRVVSGAFSPDGRCAITASDDGTARVWDTATGEPVTPPLHHGDNRPDGWAGGYARSDLPQARFSLDGRRVVLLSGSGAQSWDLRPDTRPIEDLVALAQLVGGQRIDATGGAVPLTLEELRKAWEALRAKYPEDFSASPAVVRSESNPRTIEDRA
jgi:WD40 repeat protein